MKKRIAVFALLLCLAVLLPALTVTAQAKDLDQILRYEITADMTWIPPRKALSHGWRSASPTGTPRP